MPDPFIVGIDLGGTKVAAAAFGMDGQRLGKIARLPTMANMKSTVTLMNIKRVVKQALIEGGVTGRPRAIGMGSSGPLDTERRVLLDGDSLPNLMGFEIGRFCLQEFGAPLYLENDAGCFALGEAVGGAGRSHEVLVGVTLGTGFGCGITMGGRLYSGVTHNAGEVAYCRVADSDFDSACSGLGVVREYGRSGDVGIDEALTAREIGDLAEQGNARAIRAWRSYGHWVGIAIGTICCVVDPSIVVLGGSVGSRLPLFEEPLIEGARKILPEPMRNPFRVRPSQLADAAGVTGAAELARVQVQSIAGPLRREESKPGSR